MSSTVDLTDQTLSESNQTIGELVRLLLSRDGVAVIALQPDRLTMTTLNPRVACADEDLATALLSAGWSGEDVLAFLDQRRKG